MCIVHIYVHTTCILHITYFFLTNPVPNTTTRLQWICPLGQLDFKNKSLSVNAIPTCIRVLILAKIDITCTVLVECHQIPAARLTILCDKVVISKRHEVVLLSFILARPITPANLVFLVDW